MKRKKIPLKSAKRTDYFDTIELAERWDMSEGTLRNMRVFGEGPKFEKFKNRVFYKVPVILDYEKKNLMGGF